MEHHLEMFEIMFDILLFFFIAGILVPLFQRLKISSILSYLICGIIIGPYGISYFFPHYSLIKFISIENTFNVKIFGEFGILSLMFMIGLELSIKKLKELKKYVFILGSAQIILTTSFIYFILRYFDYSLEASLLIASSLSLSSTAMSMYLIEDYRIKNQLSGVVSFSILLMQDLAVVPILVLASSFSIKDKSMFYLFSTSILLAIVSIIFIYIIGRWLLRPVLNMVSLSKNPEWLSSFVIFIIISCSIITISSNLSAALGAFLAGLLIAETEFRYEVEVILKPLKSLFLGFFFMSIGMSIDIKQISEQLSAIILIISILFLIKFLVIFLLTKIFKINNQSSIQISMFLAHPGEFTLVIIGVASSSGVIALKDGQFLILLVSIFMIMIPFLFKLAFFVSNFFEDKNTIKDSININNYEKLVIIAGFGRVGQLVSDILEKQQISYLAIENNIQKVKFFKNQGFRVIYGDAQKIDLWDLINTKSAIAAVITIDDHNASLAILSLIKAKWPFLPVIIRANHISDVNHMQNLGANYVVPETLELSLRIARIVMQELKIEQSIIDKNIEDAWNVESFG